MTLYSSRIYCDPGAVVDDQCLSLERKVEILKRWEYDARELQVAKEEGLSAEAPDGQFDAVLLAMHRLGARPNIERSAPTKQGG